MAWQSWETWLVGKNNRANWINTNRQDHSKVGSFGEWGLLAGSGIIWRLMTSCYLWCFGGFKAENTMMGGTHCGYPLRISWSVIVWRKLVIALIQHNGLMIYLVIMGANSIDHSNAFRVKIDRRPFTWKRLQSEIDPGRQLAMNLFSLSDSAWKSAIHECIKAMFKPYTVT